jgi:PEP-CTERM motif
VRKLAIAVTVLMFLCLVALTPAFADPTCSTCSLQDFGVNINGSTYDYNNVNQPDTTTLAGMNATGFSTATSGDMADTGLGTITYTFNPGSAGSYFVNFYFDEEVSTPFYNEYGTVNGSAPAGESWEIAQVNPSNGGIQFCSWNGSSCAPDATEFPNSLDNTNNLPAGNTNFLDNCTPSPASGTCNGDVATALGFNFTLTAGQEAVITITQSATNPGGFNLEQVHPVDPANPSETDIFLNGSIDIQSACTGPNCGVTPPPPGMPEPSSLMLLGMGIVGIFGTRIKTRFGRS